jgi:hypothetical protein
VVVADLKYTPVSSRVATWKPLARLSCDSRWLWFSLYTGKVAKANVVGLWPGTVNTMADDAEMSSNDVFNALDKLIAANLVEHDQENRLTRLLQLPDALDRAHTAQAIYGWFSKFKNLEACPLRDSHVPLLHWMLHQGSVNAKMEEAWRATFGRIAVPSHVPPFQPLGSADTSTVVQPSLFGPPISPSNKISNSDPSGIHQPSMAHGWDQDQDQDQVSDLGSEGEGDRGRGRPHLQLVPSPAPEDHAAAARAAYAAEMKKAVVEAGGAALLGQK